MTSKFLLIPNWGPHSPILYVRLITKTCKNKIYVVAKKISGWFQITIQFYFLLHIFNHVFNFCLKIAKKALKSNPHSTPMSIKSLFTIFNLSRAT